MMLCRDLLYIAFREAHILKRPQAVNSDSELQDGLIFLNQQVNYWAARDCYAWTTTFSVYTLTPGHQPHLMGPNVPAPDFATAGPRPIDIKSAALILTGTQPVDVPMNVRDNAWWAAQQAKNVRSSTPTDVYYEADYPNGQLWFWPIPTYPYGVRLQSTVQLQQFATLDDPFIAPQAYQSALTLTLAEELVDVWEVPMPVNLARRAIKARDALQSNNDLAPRIATADWGTSSKPAGDFNYETGTIPGL
jgi:hypothetical protein